MEKIDAEAPFEVKKPKKMEAAGDEDVDIGDEMPMNNFPPVEIEKDKDVVGGHASSSSSSSGSSSSDSSSSSGMNLVPTMCFWVLYSKSLASNKNEGEHLNFDFVTDSDSGSSSGSDSEADNGHL